MLNIALVGDSVFDNKSYVGNEPDVLGHLSNLAPDSWRVSLHAVDGSLVENIPNQLTEVAPHTSHIIISAGGNNAIMNADVLQMPVSNSAETLNVLSNRASAFEAEYREMLAIVLSRNLPTAVSTIYYPNFSDLSIQKIAVTALVIFNDVIIRQAALHGLPILDLRLVCNEPTDYATEIEPSGRGGLKIASAIIRMLELHKFSDPWTQIYF